MLSFAATQVGPGRTYGIVEFLDQLGATAGPLIVAFVLFLQFSYQAGFALLLVPAVLTVVTLLAARRAYPDPRSAFPNLIGSTWQQVDAWQLALPTSH
jgi:hypothetical protein